MLDGPLQKNSPLQCTREVPKYVLINLCELLCGKYTYVSVGLVSVCLLRQELSCLGFCLIAIYLLM